MNGLALVAVPQHDPFAALGDPSRRRIIELLADEPRSVGELADELPISRPAVSRHLKLLKESRLVTDSPEGTRRVYRLADEGAEQIETYLRHIWGDALTRLRLLAENSERRP